MSSETVDTSADIKDQTTVKGKKRKRNLYCSECNVYMDNPFTDKPTKLYHYTDFNAMRGIIVNGEIWLWNLRRMNDSQEMQYFIKKLKAAVKNQLQPSEYESMEKLFSENLKEFDSLSSYAACFSEYADDAAQWARYSKEGMGVCIVFNRELLAEIGEAGHAPLCCVNYSQNCDDMGVVKQIANLVRISAGTMTLSPTSSSSFDEKIHETFNRLITSSPLFKHPSFISEKEWRLVSLPYNVNEYLGEPHFFVEETNIKKYYVLNLRSVCTALGRNYSDLFEEIYIGPQARVTPDVLSDYFSAMGIEELCNKIKLSECPLKRF
ncbi:hypothetical protein PIROE2DRAFT_14817 [Piromyces sp. E2]|nr:hypothetical protein PIROE2DRAFT_14817 [Piromyces sp. E2]|eukprot:OUM59594.1 hypothetical protein PIROE2DRAFT_14817 [Piromyces sp. E2]